MATSCSRHNATVSRIVCASPACAPQAMLAELSNGMIAASSPQPSPRSQLKSSSAFTGALSDGEADSCQPLALRASQRVRGAGIDRLEMDLVARTQLRQARQVGGDDVADARIAADRLRLAQQHDRLPVRWQLHRAR